MTLTLSPKLRALAKNPIFWFAVAGVIVIVVMLILNHKKSNEDEDAEDIDEVDEVDEVGEVEDPDTTVTVGPVTPTGPETVGQSSASADDEYSFEDDPFRTVGLISQDSRELIKDRIRYAAVPNSHKIEAIDGIFVFPLSLGVFPAHQNGDPELIAHLEWLVQSGNMAKVPDRQQMAWSQAVYGYGRDFATRAQYDEKIPAGHGIDEILTGSSIPYIVRNMDSTLSPFMKTDRLTNTYLPFPYSNATVKYWSDYYCQEVLTALIAQYSVGSLHIVPKENRAIDYYAGRYFLNDRLVDRTAGAISERSPSGRAKAIYGGGFISGTAARGNLSENWGERPDPGTDTTTQGKNPSNDLPPVPGTSLRYDETTTRKDWRNTSVGSWGTPPAKLGVDWPKERMDKYNAYHNQFQVLHLSDRRAKYTTLDGTGYYIHLRNADQYLHTQNDNYGPGRYAGQIEADGIYEVAIRPFPLTWSDPPEAIRKLWNQLAALWSGYFNMTATGKAKSTVSQPHYVRDGSGKVIALDYMRSDYGSSLIAYWVVSGYPLGGGWLGESLGRGWNEAWVLAHSKGVTQLTDAENAAINARWKAQAVTQVLTEQDWTNQARNEVAWTGAMRLPKARDVGQRNGKDR